MIYFDWRRLRAWGRNVTERGKSYGAYGDGLPADSWILLCGLSGEKYLLMGRIYVQETFIYRV